MFYRFCNCNISAFAFGIFFGIWECCWLFSVANFATPLCGRVQEQCGVILRPISLSFARPFCNSGGAKIRQTSVVRVCVRVIVCVCVCGFIALKLLEIYIRFIVIMFFVALWLSSAAQNMQLLVLFCFWLFYNY